MRSPYLGGSEAAQDAGDLRLLTGRHHVRGGNRGCNEIGAEDTGFAGLSRAGYGSYADEESALPEFLDQRPGISDDGVGQIHSFYASVDQSLDCSQKVLFIGYPDGHYDADLADRVCHLGF